MRRSDDMDSNAYTYTRTYVPAFTAKEKRKMKELFGRGYPRQDDLSDEQVQRILTRIGPSLKGMRTEDVLHLLKYRCVLTETEAQHMSDGGIQPQEQAMRLLEYLMYKGSYGIGCLYLSLVDSSEQQGGLPTHYQLAGELQQIVQAECGVVPQSPRKIVNGDIGHTEESLNELIRRLRRIPLDTETATSLVSNLGLDPDDFPELPGYLMKACGVWLEKRSASCDLEDLVKALVYTKNLGRHTTCLCAPHEITVSTEMHNFFLSLGPKWVHIASYLGFTPQEIADISSAHPESIELQLAEFLKLWCVPECGLRTLPLLHRLKALAGIAETKNPSRKVNDQPGMPGYYNKHLKTDIHGMPHRSLETYSEPLSTAPPPSASLPHRQGNDRTPRAPGPREPGVGSSREERTGTPSPLGHRQGGPQRTAKSGPHEGSRDTYLMRIRFHVTVGGGQSPGGHAPSHHPGNDSPQYLRDQEPFIEELQDDTSDLEDTGDVMLPITGPQDPSSPLSPPSSPLSDIPPRLSPSGQAGSPELSDEWTSDSETPLDSHRLNDFESCGSDSEEEEEEDRDSVNDLSVNPRLREVVEGGRGEEVVREVEGTEAGGSEPEEKGGGRVEVGGSGSESESEEVEIGGGKGVGVGVDIGNGTGKHNEGVEDGQHGKWQEKVNEANVAVGNLELKDRAGREPLPLMGNEVEEKLKSLQSPPRQLVPAHLRMRSTSTGSQEGDNDLSEDTPEEQPHPAFPIQESSDPAMPYDSRQPLGGPMGQVMVTPTQSFVQMPNLSGAPRHSYHRSTGPKSILSPATVTYSHPSREDGGGAPAFVSLQSQPTVSTSISMSPSSVLPEKNRDGTSISYLDSPSEVPGMIHDQEPSILKDAELRQTQTDLPPIRSNTPPPDSGTVTTGAEMSNPRQLSGLNDPPAESVRAEMHSSDSAYAASSDELEEPAMLSLPNDLSAAGGPDHPGPSNAFTNNSLYSEGDGQPRETGVPDPVYDGTQREPGTCSEDVIQALQEADPQGLEMLTALVDSGANINLPTSTGVYPIHVAVNTGSPDKTLFLLNRNAKVNQMQLQDGRTALHLACIRRDFPMVQILIEKGADAGVLDRDGLSCLHYKETYESTDIVSYLLHNGAPVDLLSKNAHMTPLLFCCLPELMSYDSAHLLLSKGANANGSPMAATTPLISASGEGNERMVQLLVDNDADLNLADEDGNTALLKACTNNRAPVARLLCEYRRDDSIQRVDVDKPNKEGMTALLVAVSGNSLELAQLLVRHGANVNSSVVKQLAFQGNSYLMEVTALSEAALHGNHNIVQLLVESKAEVNAISPTAYPPIAFAVWMGHTQIVEYFLKLNDLDSSLQGLSKPLIVAAQVQNRECAQVLVGKYGDVDQILVDAQRNGMHELVECAHICRQLLSRAHSPRPIPEQPLLRLPEPLPRSTPEQPVLRLPEPQPRPTPEQPVLRLPEPQPRPAPEQPVLTLREPQPRHEQPMPRLPEPQPRHEQPMPRLPGPQPRYEQPMPRLPEPQPRHEQPVLSLPEPQPRHEQPMPRLPEPPPPATRLPPIGLPHVEPPPPSQPAGLPDVPRKVPDPSHELSSDSDESSDDEEEQLNRFDDVDTQGSGSGSRPGQRLWSRSPVSSHTNLMSGLHRPESPGSLDHHSHKSNSSSGSGPAGERLPPIGAQAVPQPMMGVQSPQPAATYPPSPYDSDSDMEENPLGVDDDNPGEVPHEPVQQLPPVLSSSHSYSHAAREQPTSNLSSSSLPPQLRNPPAVVASLPVDQQGLPVRATLDQGPPIAHSASLPMDQQGPPVRATLHQGPPSSLRSDEVSGTQASGGGHSDSSQGQTNLFAPRPKTPPPAIPQASSSSSGHVTTLQAPDSMTRSVVEVLHEFAQFMISAAVGERGHEWLIDKAVISEYSHLIQFFFQYFNDPAGFAGGGNVVSEFIGGSPSPLNFLLTSRLVTKADFQGVLEAVGRLDFPQQLLMALHEMPGSDHLPYDATTLMDSLFNQTIRFGSGVANVSSFQSSSPPVSLRSTPPPSSPPPSHHRISAPAQPTTQSQLNFPSTGGYRLGRGEETSSPPTSSYMQQTHGSLPSTMATPPATSTGSRSESHSAVQPTTTQMTTPTATPTPVRDTGVPSEDAYMSNVIHDGRPPAALARVEATSFEPNDLSVVDDDDDEEFQEAILRSYQLAETLSETPSSATSQTEHPAVESHQPEVRCAPSPVNPPLVEQYPGGEQQPTMQPVTVATTSTYQELVPLPSAFEQYSPVTVVPSTSTPAMANPDHGVPLMSTSADAHRPLPAPLTADTGPQTSLPPLSYPQSAVPFSPPDERLHIPVEPPVNLEHTHPAGQGSLPHEALVPYSTSEGTQSVPVATLHDSLPPVLPKYSQAHVSTRMAPRVDVPTSMDARVGVTTSMDARVDVPTSMGPRVDVPTSMDARVDAPTSFSYPPHEDQTHRQFAAIATTRGPIDPVHTIHQAMSTMPAPTTTASQDTLHHFSKPVSENEPSSGTMEVVTAGAWKTTPKRQIRKDTVPSKDDDSSHQEEPSPNSSQLREELSPKSSQSLGEPSPGSLHPPGEPSPKSSHPPVEPSPRSLHLPGEPSPRPSHSPGEPSLRPLAGGVRGSTAKSTAGKQSRSTGPKERLGKGSTSLSGERGPQSRLTAGRAGGSHTGRSTTVPSHPPKQTASSRVPPLSRIPAVKPTRTTQMRTGQPLSRSGSNENLHCTKAAGRTAPPKNAPLKPKGTGVERKPSNLQRQKEPSKKSTAPATRHAAQKPLHTQRASRLSPVPPKKSVPSKEKSSLPSTATRTTTTDEDSDAEEHSHAGVMSHTSESGSDTHSVSSQALLDGSWFPPLPIDEPNGNKLFESLAYRVKKWKFVGRYFGIDDETLDRIAKENKFPVEQCYKMFTTWRETFGSSTTYRVLAEALTNIMREDLLHDIAKLVPRVAEHCVQSGVEHLCSEFTLPLTDGQVDLEQVRNEFAKKKTDSHRRVEIRLQYLPTTEQFKEPLVFILPLDDLRVLSELCIAANLHGKHSIHIHAQYLQ